MTACGRWATVALGPGSLRITCEEEQGHAGDESRCLDPARAAIALAEAAGGGTVRLGPGGYGPAAPVTLHGDVRVTGGEIPRGIGYGGTGRPSARRSVLENCGLEGGVLRIADGRFRFELRPGDVLSTRGIPGSLYLPRGTAMTISADHGLTIEGPADFEFFAWTDSPAVHLGELPPA